jgi:tetratricopeptide (TPR) repeat protein
MKKIVLMVLFAVLVSILFAGDGKHDNSEFEYFNSYRDDQNAENFNTAINYYFQNENDYSSNLMLSYLCFMELEKNLEVLGSNLDSLNTRTKFSYANLLLELGKLDESIIIYDKLNEDVPKWSCPWRHKGEVLIKQNKLLEAETATLMAIETREDHFDAYVQLAKIQKDMKKYEEALKTLNKGLSYYSSDPEEEVTDEEVIELKLELEELLKKK